MNAQPAILLTQCLQWDFVGPIGKTQPLPNLLHIGYNEAMRLVGENPDASPLNRFLEWAYGQAPEALEIIHIRDWHDENDPQQAKHLEQFGPHAMANTKGADFIFTIPESLAGRPTHVINSLSLNDFIGTDLEDILAQHKGKKLNVGVIGAWTEAKVSLLCYELLSHYPEFNISVCSALTAGSSRAQHFAALSNLKRLFGVNVMDSPADFVHFLGGEEYDNLKGLRVNSGLDLSGVELPDEPERLIQHLFRDCKRVLLKSLDGGYSGNYVLGANSFDASGRERAPSVLKIGPRDPIVTERTAFERVQLVLGNNAPTIIDYVDGEKYGAIEYRYASMNGSSAQTLQKMFMAGRPLPEIFRALDEVFINQLGRLYAAGHKERCNLLDYYGFNSSMRESVEALVRKTLGQESAPAELDFYGKRILNPAAFYDGALDKQRSQTHESRYFADVHGDLNGANVLIDSNRNVWLIDFFHTHYGHVLKDLLKFENDLLYIMTPVNSARDLCLAMKLTDALLSAKDLATIPSFPHEVATDPVFARTVKALKKLRGYYPKLLQGDIDPTQAMTGLLRYAVHTMSFDEANEWQKRWALYSASKLASSIQNSTANNRELRVDWVPVPGAQTGKMGITILPGRSDQNRNLGDDINVLKREGAAKVISLVTDQELQDFGVKDLMDAYTTNGIDAEQVCVLDGAPPLAKETRRLVSKIHATLQAGENVVIHCVGGLGRSGTLAAAVLISCGIPPNEAIERVRDARSPRAIETNKQKKFLRGYKPHNPAAVCQHHPAP